MNDNPLAIGKAQTRNADTDEESAQFQARPSNPDSHDKSGYMNGQDANKRD